MLEKLFQYILEINIVTSNGPYQREKQESDVYWNNKELIVFASQDNNKPKFSW